MTLANIRQSVLELPMEDRAALIDQLWDSIDLELNKATQTGKEKRWAVESEERIDALEQGLLGTVDGPTALIELRRLVEE